MAEPATEVWSLGHYCLSFIPHVWIARRYSLCVDANADASVRNEPGCLQFDVLEPEGEGDRVLLYEIYTDKAAFDAHRKTEHFLVFSRASEGLCLKKSVTRCGLAFSGANIASKRAAD